MKRGRLELCLDATTALTWTRCATTPKQILSLGDELGLNPSTRRARGLIAPRK